jgi:hypothetical protein
MVGPHRTVLIPILSVAAIAPAFLSPQTSAAGEPAARSAPSILYADTLLIVPEPPLQTKLTVQSSATVGRIPNSYTYRYSVTNEGSAGEGICRFALAPVAVPDSVVIPPHWAASFEPDEEDGTVIWVVADTLTPPPPGWEERAAWPSPFEIQPGKIMTFVLFCRRPPAPMISFLAQVFDTLSASDVYPGDDGNPDRGGALPAAGVRGRTIGPAGAGAEGGEANAEQAALPPEPPPPHGPSGMATISFFLPSRAEVRLTVHDSRGHRVKGLIQRSLVAGFHSMTWNGTDSKGIAAAGGYSFRLFVGVTRVGERRFALRHGP